MLSEKAEGGKDEESVAEIVPQPKSLIWLATFPLFGREYRRFPQRDRL